MADPFVGEIRMAAFNFAPQDWAGCDGQIMPISQNMALYSLLGVQYGGDGKVTFALPDLRGRAPVCYNRDNQHVGDTGGTETTQLLSGTPVNGVGSTKIVDPVAPAGNNMMPYLAVNFIIALTGYYPERS